MAQARRKSASASLGMEAVCCKGQSDFAKTNSEPIDFPTAQVLLPISIRPRSVVCDTVRKHASTTGGY